MSDDRHPLDVLAGEPLLGPRQGDLLDALTHRIRNGPQLSEADAIVADWLQRTLGLPVSPAPPGANQGERE